ncbi:MAG: hypothetical protein WCA32_10415 [Chromatiaceae bacterium]
MNEQVRPANDHAALESAPSVRGGDVVDLGTRRLQVLQASVEKTRGKLKKLERRLIRGELKKGRLRRKLLKRTRALSDLEHRMTGLQDNAPCAPYPSSPQGR